MDYLNDCNSYINSKKMFFKDLQKHLPDTFYRFISPLKIIDYVNNLNDNKKSIDDDLQNILENSFSYIYECTELLTLYYNNYFQKTISVMKKYDQLINYILYLEDLSFILNNKSFTNDVNTLIKKFESILISKNTYDENLFNEAENLLLKVNSRKMPYSQQEVFEMIVEQLNL